MKSKKGKVLVVDDREQWLELINLILGNDFEVSLFTTPTQAKEAFQQAEFDLVILDKNLPKESEGLELLKYFRELKPDLPAIMLTDFASVESAVKSMKLGAADYVPKGTANLEEVLKLRVNELLKENVSNELTSLISKGENSLLEFKSSLRWDIRADKLNKDLEKVIVKTVAAFMNSENESDLLIGIEDNGNIIGLKNDYQTLKKQDQDGFENLLTTLILDACGKDCIPLIKIKFYKVERNDVCRVNIKPSSKPVFVKDDKADHFFVRAGNSTRLLTTKEALDYCRIRFG